MKQFTILLIVLSASLFASGQVSGYPGEVYSSASGNLVRTVPNAPIVFCNYPASGGPPCTNLAATFTSLAGTVSCPAGQGVLPTTSTCSSTADAQGNYVFYAAAGNYTYYFQVNNTWNGPYSASLGGGGGGSGTITGVTAGAGLQGGGLTGNIPLSMLLTCSNGQTMQWNGATWVCASVGAAAGAATELQLRCSGGGFCADSSLFYNLLSHTLAVTNINVNGIMTWLNAFGISTNIPATSACIPAAGTASFGVSSDGNFATSNNGSPCVDINSSAIPTGVVKGSALVSNGAAANPVYQSKSFLDVRDIAGVDCTGVADSAAALTAFTGAQPGTNNAITGKTLSFGSCPQIKLATTWVIYNQAGFIIDGFTRSGAASKGINFSWSGAANGVMIDCEYCDGFIMRGLNIQGNANAGVGIQIDKNGAGGIWNTTDGILTNNTYQGANQNWVGVLISPVSVQNVEDIRISDSAFYCNATVATTAGVGIKIGNSPNAKNEIIKHINVTNCLYGVWKINGSFQVLESEFSANGGTCATGSGADIRDDTNTDVDIIEGNLDENSLQGISFTAAQGHPVIVKGNHAAPAGCDNTSRYWFNTGTGSGSWLFDGNSWDPDSSLVKVIGTASGQTGQTIYTRGNLYPNSIFTPWWTLGVSAIGDDVQVSGENLLVYAGQTGGVLPQAGSNYPSPFQVFRGYLNGSLTADDFAEQFIPAGTAGSSGGTFLLKHQQGATGTEMFAFDGSYPGMTIAQIPTPAAPTITNTGAAGAVTDTYSVVAYGASGNTVGSSTGSTATANATLTTSNFNVIAFDSVPGAVKYCIWRTVAGGTPSTLGNIGCMSALQINFRFHSNVWGTAYANNNAGVRNHYLFNDTGLAGDSASLPASNTTGGLSVAGPLTITSTTRVSNLHTSGNPDLISCGGTTTCSNTRQVNGYTVYGSATLAAGTLAYAGLPFASTTWLCNTWDITTPGTTSSMVQVTDATHATITGTGTDVIGFHCDGN